MIDADLKAWSDVDVGGGNLLDTAAQALSKIPLRWMIREVIKSNCGIQFDDEALQLHGIPSTKAISATGVTAEEVSLNGLDAVQLVNDELRNMVRISGLIVSLRALNFPLAQNASLVAPRNCAYALFLAG
jgi:hypothetical protein